MGSFAHAGLESAKALLAQMERVSRESVSRSGKVDYEALREILDDALDDLSTRPMVMLYLVAYLSHCLAGSIPDRQTWSPPFL